MPLKIYYSDRIEDLANHLKERLLRDRTGADPFVFPQVVVPNTNIAKWLQIRIFSKERMLCAGIRFPFMEQRLTDLMAANLPEGAPFSLLPDHAYANAIMAALLAPRDAQPEFDALAPLRDYVSGAGESGGAASGGLAIRTQRQARMGWQLAVKMADLMDEYEVRRPEIVENWLRGLPADGGGQTETSRIELAEAALARCLWGRGGAFPPDGEQLSLRQLYDRVSGAPPKGPSQTIYFFGHSTLSLLQVKILAWLARTHEVVFYHNNVCLEYWGDIETKDERIRRLGKAHAAAEDISVENPLLQQWGVAGRETMRLLVELEEENDGRIDFDWTCVADLERAHPHSVLGKIQESICHRTGEIDGAPQDASLQIVGVPGIRREVEMVYNAILGSVWKPEGSGKRPWPGCGFSDIAVLVPDMARYRPAIEAVFDARGQIPYGLIDTTASEDSALLAGFMALADLARRGLTRETLFAVLYNPCVQKALGFSDDEVDGWRQLTARLGAFDGFEDDDGISKFNWDWALSRLRLARVADRLPVGGGREDDIPLVGDGSKNDLKFSEVVELIYRKLRRAFNDETGRRTLPCAAGTAADGAAREPNWAHALGRLVDDFLAVPDESPLEETVKRQISQTLAGLAVLPGKVDCEVALAAVEQFVGGISCRKGGYLTDGVTIAGLLPMRPVPFRQIFVLGLGAGGFPGRTSASTLDVRGAGWRLGDTARPKVNRYLFLETVMSARDRLVLSYQNHDIEKDAELFPAGIIRELEDFAGRAILGKPFEEFQGYPLLERGEAGGKGMDGKDVLSPVCDVVWSPEDPQAGILPTYSEAARRMAGKRAKAAEGAGTMTGDDVPDGNGGVPQSRREVSSKELAEFLKSPLRAELRYRLGIAVEGYRDTELEADSPLGIPEGPDQWELEEESLGGEDGLGKRFRQKQLAGQLPMGFLGDFAWKSLDEKLKGSIGALREFAAGFGVLDGEDHTSRQRVPLTVAAGGAEADGKAVVNVQYVAETPNWVESETGVSVLVSGRLVDAYGNLLPWPIDRTLAPFLGFLMRQAGRADDDEGGTVLRVGVIDISNAQTAVWRWNVRPQEARAYLGRLTWWYWSFLEGERRPSPYADFTYKKLAKAIKSAETAGTFQGGNGEDDWADILFRLTAEEWRGAAGAKGFNGALVVENAIDAYCRDPDAKELETLYRDFYSLPLSGVKESDGGAA